MALWRRLSAAGRARGKAKEDGTAEEGERDALAGCELHCLAYAIGG